jgi:hypothetical protein
MDVFALVPKQDRGPLRADYRAFLAARDGTLDLEARTLSKREERLQRFFVSQGSRSRAIDRDLFDSQYARFDTRRSTPDEVLLLLSLLKVNAAEAFGVSETFDRVFTRAKELDDDTELLLLVEESYHTKILLSAASIYGLEVSTTFTPPAALRALISGILHAPDVVARPLTLAGEILGTMVILNLLEATGRVFRDEPVLRDAIEERLTDVLVDEIGHVSFNRLCLGPAGLAQARLLLPIVATGLGNSVPEIGLLGAAQSRASAERFAATVRRLPAAVRDNAFFA